MYRIFIHPSIGGHWGCLHVLAVVNNAATNTRVHTYFHISVFIFFKCISRSGITGSCDSFVFNFGGTSVLFSTAAAPVYNRIHSARDTLTPVFWASLIAAILMGVVRYLTVVWFAVPQWLVTLCVFSRLWWAIRVSSGKVSVQCSGRFLIVFFGFLFLSYMNSFYTLDVKSSRLSSEYLPRESENTGL